MAAEVSAFPTRRRRRAIVRSVLVAADVLALVIATQMASLIRFGRVFHLSTSPNLPTWFNVIDLSFLMVAIWVVLLWSDGLTRAFLIAVGRASGWTSIARTSEESAGTSS